MSALVTRGAFHALLVGLPLALLACAPAENSEDSEESEHDLIGGHVANDKEFPATLLIRGSCTAARVGPRHILTAAHCIGARRYAPGATFEITASKGIGRFAPAAGDGFRAVTVESVEVDPAWTSACVDKKCERVTVSGRTNIADVAVITLREDLGEIPQAVVDLTPVKVGDRVVVSGYGCEVAVGERSTNYNRRLRISFTKTLPFDSAIHPGSYLGEVDRNNGLADTMANLYSITPGPASNALLGDGTANAGVSVDADEDPAKNDGAEELGGLCPGDSGGPLYRADKAGLTVIGVNANYTFSRDSGSKVHTVDGITYRYGGSPVTNWHTRLDGASGLRVGLWLKSLGVNVK